MSLVTRSPDPSGSHTGSAAPSARCDTLRASPPAAGTAHTCAPESRVEMNASALPSGDQRGCRADPGPLVSWRDWPVVTLASQTRETLRLSWSEGIETVYATHLPSGDSWGSLTDFRVMKSSNLSARRCARSEPGQSRTHSSQNLRIRTPGES